MTRGGAGALGVLSLAGALWVGMRPPRPVPPLGSFLDPANGVWALAAHAEHPERATMAIASLTAAVDVRYDDRGVPHIFAHNELDAIRALGYVVARDRLFQLELQTRAAAGTLTELVGAAALTADQNARRVGLPWGAHRKFAAVPVGSMAMRVLQAYADGVNAYIDHMRPADLPIEYRLLNKRPQRWQSQNTMLLLVRMGYTLAFSNGELQQSRIEARIGRAAATALFPRDAYIQEPVQPNGQRAARIDPIHLPPPHPDSAAAAMAALLSAIAPRRDIANPNADRSLGSNNWAVSPARSASGYALLANDPHLDLSLPSTWYEAHLVVRDSLDVYGVTFPGAPAIALGFNRDVAWGATNVGADVADYYVESVDDSVSPKHYQVDGRWRQVARSVEAYRDARGATLWTDTLYYTHRGPLFRTGDLWISERWMVLEPSTDFEAFRLAQRARSVKDYFDAMASLESPAQNFIAADRGGHIGIRSTGRYPLRSDGEHLLDGRTSATDWHRWITPADAPQSYDPPQGYLASANQQPADPRVFTPYLGTDWPTPWRAMHINDLLRADSAVTPDKMRLFQTDAGNARADAFVPLLIEAAQSEIRAGRGDSTLQRAAALLGDWDRRFTLDNQRAVLFEEAMRELTLETWDELRADSSADSRLIATPEEQVLYALTRDPTNIWWDRVSTPVRETRDMILASSLRTALVRIEQRLGPASSGRWRWSRLRFENIWHPLRIPALSALELPVQGGRESLNPSFGAGVHGASWRLVAEMGPTVRAWAIYPGGQSANPLSSHYRDHIESWRRGELDSLRVPASADALVAPQLAATLTLTPARH